jgi:hypothetical protein
MPEPVAGIPMGALQRSATPPPATSGGGAAPDDPFGLHLEGSSAQAIAAHGVEGGGGALPHREAIQASFGRHDVSGISGHVGGPAAQASAALGAEAYATGDHVAFTTAPSLHLAAHEAAHVVQQRAGVSLKGGVGEAGDRYERHADAVADAVVAGRSAEALLDHDPGHGVGATGGGGAGGAAIQRQQPGAAAPAAAPASAPADAPGAAPAAPAASGGDRAVFVPFDTNGNWNAADVLARLGAVPADLADAITAGPRPTARLCVALRDRVNAAAAKDAGKKAACDEIARALTSRITELVYATPQSPLTYDQLRKVGEWDHQFPAGEATPAADAPAAAAAASAVDPVEEHARQMANREGYRVPGDHDVIRNHVDAKEPKKGKQYTQANDVEEDNPQFPGWRFVRDPFDNTVVAVKPDGTCTQYVFKVETSETGATLVLDRKEELSRLRVAELARLDKAGLGEAQESEQGRKNRIQRDKDIGVADRDAWAKASPANAKAKADYEAAMAKWQADKAALPKGSKPPPPPPWPAGMPTDKMTTACTNWTAPVYHAGGGAQKTTFSFTPPTEHPGWRDAKSNPGGPKPGDLYWLFDRVRHRTAHMGVFKSKVSAGATPDGDPLETWTVTDGGQGGYQSIQEVQERTRGPYNPKTRVFSSSIAEAGQSKGDRELTGWIDVDEEHAAEPVST